MTDYFTSGIAGDVFGAYLEVLGLVEGAPKLWEVGGWGTQVVGRGGAGEPKLWEMGGWGTQVVGGGGLGEPSYGRWGGRGWGPKLCCNGRCIRFAVGTVRLAVPVQTVDALSRYRPFDKRRNRINPDYSDSQSNTP